ncbi:MAG TPA: hypothetical protein VF516_00230 [Kofleriaceae bacterium]
MVAYPIIALNDGDILDPQWIDDITDAANDHQTRVTALEQGFNPQVSYTTNGVMASSTGAEVAMTAWTGGVSSTFLFKAGWVHEMVIQFGGSDSTAGSSAGRQIARVRKGVNTIVGQQLALMYLSTVGNSGAVTTGSATRYVKNATGADISTQIGMTIQRQTGAGTITLYGDTDVPLTLAMRPLGLISQLTNFAAVAVSIT